MRHLRLREFVLAGELCHFARVHITAVQQDPSDDDSHDHNFPEVFWVEAGWGWHFINGMKRELRPGHLILISPKDCHAFAAGNGSGLRIANVAFFRKSWRYVHQRYFPASPDPFELSEEAREFCLWGHSRSCLDRLAENFGSPGRNIVQIEGFLLELGNMILFKNKESRDYSMPDWLVRACHDICMPDYLAGGTRAFASLAGRTPDHVARAAKRWLKKTPSEIVNEARMEYAAARLVSSDETILNIALQCGFNNLAHFYMLFQKRFHTTPRQYRLGGRRIVSGSERNA